MSRISEALDRAARREAPGVPSGPSRERPSTSREYRGEHEPSAVRAVRISNQFGTAVSATPPAVRRTDLHAPRTSVARARPDTLVVGDNAPAWWIDEYRRLAGALEGIQSRSAWGGAAAERGLKTLLVASAVSGEGRTLTVVNLALTLSEFYRRRVLLIDADLRRPSIHELLDVPSASGLSDIIHTKVQPELHAFSPMLSVLPAGQPRADAMGWLTSDRLASVLEPYVPRFDWVLVDTPPVTHFANADELARFTRAVLFVIGSGSTPYPIVQRAISTLGHGCIVGTVLNKSTRVARNWVTRRRQE